MKTVMLLGVALVASGCVHFECTLHGGDEVRSLRTEHFIVTSDLPIEAHRQEALRLELLWDTFAAFFRAQVDSAQVPVVILKNTDIVESFAEGYSGFVRRDGPRVLVVGAVKAEQQTHDTNAHELTHLVSAFMLPRQPRWLSEGLATLFEDAAFKDTRTVRMGRWNAGRAAEAFQVGVLSLEELSQWNGLTFEQGETLYYASAWAWVHYLVNHEETRLLQLFAGLRGSKPLPEVMNELFPPEEAKRLHEKVKAYLAEARFRGWETTLLRTPKVEAPVVLAPWEVHVLRSQLYLRDVGAETREQVMAVSLAPVPLPPVAAVIKAELDGRSAKELLAEYPTSPAVLVAAHGRFNVDADVAKLEEALQRPDADAELLLLGANTALRSEPSDPKRARTYADRGAALAPWSVELAVARVQIALALEDCEEARFRVAEAASLLSERASPEDVGRMEKLRERVGKCPAR